MSKPTPVAVVDRVFNSVGLLHATVEEGKLSEGDALYPSSALQALEEENEMLRQHVEELQQKNAAETCACSYDGPGTVCDGHSPKLAAAEARLEEALKVIEPFAKAFEKARITYSKRYSDITLGEANFDKMPDIWPMDTLTFNMGQFRAARRFMEESR
ncbi:hypothetical protein ASD54_12550 [Rhizobium sp. Root149]|uniref:hypothetical protein n=1 Tax=Rhizobium sp. Root149 TaxID=1736473 RepID=UPI00071423C9|nr:hypothetical protein [Rhizobium sp. Root149]KQZ49760.1 hypothetical protein ASD54_12550 [Rhizobium sp. Root149]